MAYAGAGNYSYGDTSIRESLWDQIKDLDATETYVTSNAGVVNVTQKVHSWNSDPMVQSTNAAGVAENADTTFVGTNPELISNHTQIIERGIQVSMSSQNAEFAGIDDKFAREQMKKMKEWKQIFEISATVGTLVSGTGTAARTMQGFIRFATLTTAHSGVSLTSDMLNFFLQNAWQNGGEHDTVLVGATLKSRISSFTSTNTRNVAADDATIVGRVDVYDSDYGRVEIVLHRYVNQMAANSYLALATYIKDYVKVGFLDQPHYEDRAQLGYYKAGSVVGEATVMLANRLAAQNIRGLL